MSGTPRALREELRDNYDEHAVQRVWQGVVQRRARRARRRRGAWATAGGLALAAAVAIVARGTRPSEPGPLHQVGGGEPSLLSAPLSPSAPETTFALDDGSRVAMAAGGRATVVENSGRAFVVVLSEGRATFDVHPGGPRRWAIECGLATVEVVGTRFTIDRGAGSVVVSVDHGIVLVRGERVPERAQRLGAGQSLRLDRVPPPSATAAAATPAPARPAERAMAVTATATATTAARRSDGVPWRDLVRSHEYRRAYGTLGRGGIERSARSATPQELLWLADIARLSGHPGDAVLPLRRLIDENPRDASAPIALFTLGRIQLDSLGDSRGAADSFARAIAAGVPRSLGEDAAARLVEAYARAGDRTAARAAADRYLGAYPDGRAAADVRRWAAAR